MKTALLTIALLFILFSCRKETEEQVDILGKYKITGMVFKSAGNADQDLLPTLPDCAEGNRLLFETNSIFRMLSCDQGDNEPGRWSVKGKKLTIDGVQSEIVSFDQHTLILSTPMTFFDIAGTVIETLEKQ